MARNRCRTRRKPLERVVAALLTPVLALSTALTCTGCSYGDVSSEITGKGPDTARYEPLPFDPALPQGTASLEASKAAWTGDEQGFWHAHLEGRERMLYDTIYPHLAARDTEFELGSLKDLFEEGRAVSYYYDEEDSARDQASKDAFWDDYGVALYAICYDHPELFWLDGADSDLWGESDWTYDESGDAVGMRVFGIAYGMGEDEVAQTQAALDAKVEEALATVPTDGTDYEQAWAVYKWLSDNVSYAEEVAEAIDAGDNDKADELSGKYQGADTALVGGVSVCSGYSRAYQLLLGRLGIPCAHVVGLGDPLDPEAAHAWNLVCLGGRYGYTDVTWGDMPYTESIEFPDGTVKEYDFNDTDPIYFFMSDADMEYDGRVALDDYYPESDDYTPQNPHPYTALLPACDSIIWEDDRYEPGDYWDEYYDIWYRWVDPEAEDQPV